MAKAKKEPQQKHVKLPIKWNIPASIVTRYASNMVVQNLEDAFKISFFEAVPEILVDPTEAVPAEVRADCVASIVVTRDKFPSFIRAMQIHLDNYNEARKRIAEKP